MKFLRILLIVIVVLIVVGGLLALIAPTDMNVKRSTVINAPRDVVYSNIASQRNLHKWYPWDKMDSNINVIYEGNEGTVGETSKWKSEIVGEGEQSITALEPGKRVDTHIKFIEPFTSEAVGLFELRDTTDGTVVTWEFKSKMPRPMNIRALFFDVGKDFEQGLGYLKEVSEKEATSTPVASKYQINEMDMPAKVFVGKRATISFQDIGKFYSENLPKAWADAEKAKLEINGPASGIFYTFDTVNMKTDMAAVVPVKEVKSPIRGWETFNAPAGKALEVDYYGAYDKSQGAYYAINVYMAQKGMKSKSFVVEEYPTDPTVEKDTAKWLTKIYYYVE